MKTFKMTTKFWILAMVAVLTFTTSCKKFDVPPVESSLYTLPEGATVITIAALKQLHTPGTNPHMITDCTYIKGVVVSSDESGNIYKNLFIQDATGGIGLSLNKTSLYTEYPVGQRIYVKLKGLYIGEYARMIQLGGLDPNDVEVVGRLDEVFVAEHLLKDSLPGAVPPATAITLPITTDANVGMLVKLENVSIVEAGMPFAPPSVSVSMHLTDQINQVILRNSGYADFAADTMPSGVGTVYGILTYYNWSENFNPNSYQVLLRDKSDVTGGFVW